MSFQGNNVWCPVPGQAKGDGDAQELGVVAGRSYCAGELVERCYCLPFRKNDLLDPLGILSPWSTWLYNCSDEFWFAFGWGMLYNEPERRHASNLAWECEVVQDDHGVDRHYLSLRARRDVVLGEELCIRRRKDGGEELRSSRDMLGVSLRWLAARFPASLPERPTHSRNLDIIEGVLSASAEKGIEIRSSSLHGNGVFATKRFRINEVIEVVPNLIIADAALDECLSDYRFGSFNEHVSRIALGLGSVYNHNDIPNVKCYPARTAGGPLAQRFSSRYVAARHIEVGEELFISYGNGWWKSRGLTTANYKQGGMYTGDICKVTRKRHGEGTYCYPSGEVYSGQWQDGSMHGRGRFLSAKGCVYSGTYLAGKRHGWGVLTRRSGTTEFIEYDHGDVVSDRIRINCDGNKAWCIKAESEPFEIHVSEACRALPESMRPFYFEAEDVTVSSFLDTLD